MNSRTVAPIIALVVAIPIALWLGVSVAQDQVTTLVWILGVVFLAVCFALGKNVWILIPASMGFQGGLNFIPGAPAAWHLVSVIVAGFYLLRIATRRQQLVFRWTTADTALLLVFLTILQTYVRNPTGFAVFGGALAGGKPYFTYCAAFGAYAVLATADADIKSFRLAIIALISTMIIDSAIAATSSLSPEFARVAMRFYSNVSLDAASVLNYSTDLRETRLNHLAQIGIVLGLIASTLWRPITALDFTKPWRALIALGAVVFSALGGFRIGIAILGTQLVVGSLARRKVLDALAIGLGGTLFFAGIAVVVPNEDIPYSVQRVMTLLPGYSARADIERDAKASAELRFRMWRLVMKGDRFISNKILGDGFQVSRAEADLMVRWAYGDKKIRETVNIEEILLANGAYHGFHVETIRYTGFVGLAAATFALIAFGIMALRNINYYLNRKELGFVMFICLPFLIHWFWYWLAWGDYKTGFPSFIAYAGLVKLLHVIIVREKADSTGQLGMQGSAI